MSGFHSDRLYHEYVGYWSNVYGFEMNVVSKNILADGHVLLVPADDIVTSDCCIKVNGNILLSKTKISFRIWIFIHVQMMILLLPIHLLYKH